jgi:carboxyl-terminal processing protease
LVIILAGCLEKAEVKQQPTPAAPAAAAKPVEAPATPAAAVKETPKAAAAATADKAQVKQAIDQSAADIYKGDFKDAAAILAKVNASDNQTLSTLKDVVADYEKLAEKRKKVRQAEYDKQIAELAKIRKSVEDGNDVNDLSTVFSVVWAARELSDPNDKGKLLEDPFVKKMMDESFVRAKEFEAKGKWEEALAQCYSWMSMFYEDNKEYKDTRDRLRQMYFIKESLTDNPCEKMDERFSGIRKQMFVQAIKVLDLYHVKVLDYDAMAKAALKRCLALGDVLPLADTFKANSLKREGGAVAAWNAGLNGYLDEMKDSQIPLTRDKFILLFDNVLKLNKTTINIPDEMVIAFYSEAALDEIDPYTNLVWPWQITEFEKTMTQEFTGIGIEINKEAGKLTVASLLPDTPAASSGLDAGDIIEKVDGEPTADMTLQCAVRKITGPSGSSVDLTIRHKDSDKSEEITIKRGKIVVPTVRGWTRTDSGKWLYMVDEKDKIGFIRITNFADTTSEQLEAAISGLERQGMKGLILDLRYNTGGYLESAKEIVDKFIDEGPIVSTRPRVGTRTSEVRPGRSRTATIR